MPHGKAVHLPLAQPPHCQTLPTPEQTDCGCPAPSTGASILQGQKIRIHFYQPDLSDRSQPPRQSRWKGWCCRPGWACVPSHTRPCRTPAGSTTAHRPARDACGAEPAAAGRIPARSAGSSWAVSGQERPPAFERTHSTAHPVLRTGVPAGSHRIMESFWLEQPFVLLG